MEKNILNPNYYRPRPHHAGSIFENEGFTLKTHQMFSAHTTVEESKNATITGHFRFVIKENKAREIVFKTFSVQIKMQSRRPQSPPAHGKLRFRDGFSIAGRPNPGIKAAFSNFSGVAVWTLPLAIRPSDESFQICAVLLFSVIPRVSSLLFPRKLEVIFYIAEMTCRKINCSYSSCFNLQLKIIFCDTTLILSMHI